MKRFLVLFILLILSVSIGILSCNNTTEETYSDNITEQQICFPQHKEHVSGHADSMIIGEMVLDDYYLKINEIIIIWQMEYSLFNNEGNIEVLDENGKVVARVGEEVYMGGGETSSIEHVNSLIKEPLPPDCQGPFWFQGSSTRLNLNFSSDLFSLEVTTYKNRKYYFIRKKPVLDEFFIMNEVVTGKLVACYDAYCLKCPTLLVGEVPLHYTPLWPAECTARVKNGFFEVLDESGKVVAREGEIVKLEGNLRCGIYSDISKQLHEELPGECSTCYFNVLKIINNN